MKTILAIDDTDLILVLISKFLAQQNYSVDTCNSPDAALQKLGTTRYDMILLDIVMPGKNGIEILKHIKQHEKNKITPVIMLSARDDMNSIQECLKLGAVDYIIKPLDLVAMQKRLEEFL